MGETGRRSGGGGGEKKRRGGRNGAACGSVRRTLAGAASSANDARKRDRVEKCATETSWRLRGAQSKNGQGRKTSGRKLAHLPIRRLPSRGDAPETVFAVFRSVLGCVQNQRAREREASGRSIQKRMKQGWGAKKKKEQKRQKCRKKSWLEVRTSESDPSFLRHSPTPQSERTRAAAPPAPFVPCAHAVSQAPFVPCTHAVPPTPFAPCALAVPPSATPRASSRRAPSSVRARCGRPLPATA